MGAPQIIKTESGEELVVLSRADYEAMVDKLAEAAEDAADGATYDGAKAAIARGDGGFLSPGRDGRPFTPRVARQVLQQALQ